MPGFNGSGTFERAHDFTDDAAADVKIRSDRVDTELDNVADGLSNCLTLDGQSTPTAALPMGNQRLTALGDPQAAQDAATRNWIDQIGTVVDLAGLSAQGVTQAIQAAADELGTAGGTIILGAGTRTMTAPSTTHVSANEGDCVQLTADHGHIRILGQGDSTVLKPASNTLCLFSCNGNASLTLENIHFDNSDNGILQNEVKPTRQYEPNLGLAGYGNGCNAVVIQHDTASVYLRGVRSTAFHTLVFHRGVAANNTTLAGTVAATDVQIIGGVHGFLVQQPEYVRLSNSYAEDIVQSINSDASNDPGHIVYVTDRTGAKPYLVQCVNIQCARCESNVLKCNKAERFVATGCSFVDVNGGFRVGEVFEFVITGSVVHMSQYGSFLTSQEAVSLSDAGTGIVAHNIFEYQEHDCAGIRAQTNVGDESYMNRGLKIYGNTFRSSAEHASGQTNPDVAVNGWSDVHIGENTHELWGSTNRNARFINVDNSDRVYIKPPIHYAPDGAGFNQMIRLEGTTDNCHVYWDDTLVDFTPGANTITDNASGTNNKVLNVAREEGSATPSVAFATNGNFSPTNTTYKCVWRRDGDWVWFTASVDFDTNAYSTASGDFRIDLSDMGFTASDEIDEWPLTLSNVQMVDFATDQEISAHILAGDDFVVLRRIEDAAAGNEMNTNHFPASTSGYALTVSGRFKRA